MGSELGLSSDKLLAVTDPDIDFERRGELFSARERLALTYADAMTLSELDVSDEMFDGLREHFGEDAIVELTAVIAWENASSKFNRALRVDSQRLWHEERSRSASQSQSRGAKGDKT